MGSKPLNLELPFVKTYSETPKNAKLQCVMKLMKTHTVLMDREGGLRGGETAAAGCYSASPVLSLPLSAALVR